MGGGAAAGPPARIETRLRRGSPGGSGGLERPGGRWSGRGTPRQDRDAAPPRLAGGLGGSGAAGRAVERPRDPPPGSRRGSAAARRGARGVWSGRAGGGAAAGPPARIETRLRRGSPGGSGGLERPGGRWSGRGTPRPDRWSAIGGAHRRRRNSVPVHHQHQHDRLLHVQAVLRLVEDHGRARRRPRRRRPPRRGGTAGSA